MNKEELALHFLQEYYNIPTNWEDYKTIQNAIRKNQQLKEQLEASERARKEAIELVKNNQRKDEFVELNEWQARDLISILDIDKGE